MCHNLHGSAGAKLIAETVIFGKWNLPLRFVKTDTCGGCSPRCHKSKYYDGQSTGKKPAAPESVKKAQ